MEGENYVHRSHQAMASRKDETAKMRSIVCVGAYFVTFRLHPQVRAVAEWADASR